MWNVRLLNIVNTCHVRAAARSVLQLADGCRLARHHELYPPVSQVTHPAAHAEVPGGAGYVPAESHALDSAAHDEANLSRAHCSAPRRFWRTI